MADQFNYFFRFNDFFQTVADPIVSPYLTQASSPLQPLTVYDTGSSNSIVPLSGYWLMILAPNNVVPLETHPRLQFLLNRDLETTQPQASAIINNLIPPIQLPNLQILTGTGIPYCVGGLGLIKGGPPADWILATGFWDDAGFWRDNATWID